MSRGRGIQSIEVGGRLLSVLTERGGPVMLKDLAQQSGLVPAQVHAYLASFSRIGLVEQDSRTGQYALGPFAARLGLARMRSVPVYARATDALRHLADSFDLMAMMVAWGPAGPTAIQVQGGSQLNLNIRRGTQFSLTGTASGQVFAAWPPNAEARVTDKAFARAMGTVRERGYATALEEPIPGISAYAAPVFDRADALVLAVAIVGKSETLRGDDTALEQLLMTTRALSKIRPTAAGTAESR